MLLEEPFGHSRLEDLEPDAVADDVVQLAGDAQPLLRHGLCVRLKSGSASLRQVLVAVP